MGSFRNNGLDLNSISGIGSITTPQVNKITVFAVSSAPTAGRTYAGNSTIQLWMADANGGLHEVTNDWLQTKVSETSAKLDFIYPAVSAFMSAGILYNNYPQQTLTGSLDIIGNLNVNGAAVFNNICATDQFTVDGQFNISSQGTTYTFENITPFYVRSSANRLSPDGRNDPRLLYIGNEVIYNEYKASDRGLRFTVINRQTYNVVHDEIYDTAGSQTRAPDLAYDMFRFMNNKDNLGILNSRECWEALIGDHKTSESQSLSAVDVNPAYANYTIGSLMDQFNRFGLMKAIYAAQMNYGSSISGTSFTQYCSIFEGSDILDNGNKIYDSNRSVESLTLNTHTIPVSGEIQRACLTGWLIKPRNVAPDYNVVNNNATFIATPYSPNSDIVTNNINFINSNATNGAAAASIDSRSLSKLVTTYFGINDIKNIFGTSSTITEIASSNLTRVCTISGTSSITNNIRGTHNEVNTYFGVSNITHDFLSDSIISYSFPSTASYITLHNNILTGIRLARDNQSLDAVNKALLDQVCPIGEVKDYAGSSLPAGDRFLWCDGTYYDPSDKAELFAVLSYTHGQSGSLFRVPNYNGKMLIGADGGMFVLGNTGGSTGHKLTIDEMPIHEHPPASGNYNSFTMHLKVDDVGYTTNDGLEGLMITRNPLYGGSGTKGATATGFAGGDQPFSIMPPFAVCNKIIRYR